MPRPIVQDGPATPQRFLPFDHPNLFLVYMIIQIAARTDLLPPFIAVVCRLSALSDPRIVVDLRTVVYTTIWTLPLAYD